MKKITFDIDDLQVDSFKTTPDQRARHGTVRGNDGSITCDPNGTAMTDCWGNCGGGGMTETAGEECLNTTQLAINCNCWTEAFVGPDCTVDPCYNTNDAPCA